MLRFYREHDGLKPATTADLIESILTDNIPLFDKILASASAVVMNGYNCRHGSALLTAIRHSQDIYFLVRLLQRQDLNVNNVNATIYEETPLAALIHNWYLSHKEFMVFLNAFVRHPTFDVNHQSTQFVLQGIIRNIQSKPFDKSEKSKMYAAFKLLCRHPKLNAATEMLISDELFAMSVDDNRLIKFTAQGINQRRMVLHNYLPRLRRDTSSFFGPRFLVDDIANTLIIPMVTNIPYPPR